MKLSEILINTFSKLGLNVKEFKDLPIFKEYLNKAEIVTFSYWVKLLRNRAR